MEIDIENFDPMSPTLEHNHWEALTALRECPVAHSTLYGGLRLLARYDDVFKAICDWRTFSSASGTTAVPIKSTGATPIPITTDPPMQRDLRRLIDPHFGPRQVAAAEPAIREVAVGLIESFRHTGSCDFVLEYSSIISPTVFFDYAFGVKPDESGRVMEWVTKLLQDPVGSGAERQALLAWTQTMLDARQVGEPCGDVIDSINAGKVDGEPLTDVQRRMVLMNLVIGGAETSGHGISEIVYQLARSPELRRRLAAERELIPAAIEEFLRHEPPVPVVGRTATCPAVISDGRVDANERVVLYLGAANRDPAIYGDPEEIILDRFTGTSRPQPPMTFGTGVHRCPGAHLARMEMVVTVQEVLDRLPGLNLPAANVYERTTGTSRGLKSLPLTFKPPTR